MTLINSSSDPKIINETNWRKSTRSVPTGDCVEINRGQADLVGVRDSKHVVPASTLTFHPSAWDQFLRQLKA